MSYYSKLIWQLKRKIVNVLSKLTVNLSKPQSKFIIEMVFGILKSESIILSDIAHALDEDILPKKTIERLSRNLALNFSNEINQTYLTYCLSLMDQEMKIFCVDDSDIIKPYGKKFESLGKVRDGSSIDKSIEKGYITTSIIGITKTYKHPICLYNKVHSSYQKKYQSVNKVTFEGLELIMMNLKNYSSIFTFDRGYDSNDLIKYFITKKQYFVIRLTKRRTIIVKNKHIKLIEAMRNKKGKIIIPTKMKGKTIEVKASHLEVKLNGFSNRYTVIFAYSNNSDEPMMLLTNKEISSKSDVIMIVLTYISRWKIEEYFRFKKVVYKYEDFRVRKLKAINFLTFLIDISIFILSIFIESQQKSILFSLLIKESKKIKEDVYLLYYQLSSGISTILGHNEMGIKNNESIEHRYPKQLQLFKTDKLTNKSLF